MKHTLTFRGGAERSGPLTMGQSNMLRCLLRDGAALTNIHDVWPVPHGSTTAAVLDALRALVLRHEALRTVLPHHDEQLVLAEGEFTVIVVDREDLHVDLPADLPRIADELARRDRDRDFRLAEELPLRFSLLTVRGEPVHLAVAANHVFTDGGALAVLREDWLALLGGADLPAPDSLTPIELAAEETSPDGKLKSEAAMRHWEQVIRTGPQAVFAEPRLENADGPAPRLTLRSRRGARALARTAERTGAPPATVLLAAWCALVGHRAGQRACVTAMPTANRFNSRLARSITPLSQDALLLLDLRVPGFDGLLRKTWGAALNAYRHGRFDAHRLWEMIDRTTTERGSHFARDVVFNDVSALNAFLGESDRTDLPEAELTWGPTQALPTRLLGFAHQIDPLLHLSLWADPALFERTEAEGFLTGLLRLLEAAAEGDLPLADLTAVTGVAPADRGPDWQRVDGCWVRPQAIAEALSEALDGLPAHVADEDDGTLTAWIATGGRPLTPAAAHTALLARLPARTGVLAPRRYVLVPAAPAGGDWRALRPLAEGSGR
ncbi:condensation domain-containing protein [Kitasatospora sp. NBC_01287]|uniref:condensation domain-containing protein n=1 Tax=Kitasatospora sp. NBC_01287 TaxID=2903573 RepID=UPI00225951B2|nr:condensation domain-containing protein [Kitasatospora sp. NBC_01287]MCX4751283.1 condensation domain-containing protein [Kitasatospora sp. NBC_01287]